MIQKLLLNRPQVIIAILLLILPLLAIFLIFFYKPTIFLLKPFLFRFDRSYGINFTPQTFEISPNNAPVVYQKQNSFLATGKILEIDKETPALKILGASQTFLKTKLDCQNRVVIIYLGINLKKEVSLNEALAQATPYDTFFGACNDAKCRIIVKSCTLIKKSLPLN